MRLRRSVAVLSAGADRARLAAAADKRAGRENSAFRRGAIFDFAAGVQLLDRLIGSLRRCCRSLPDRRRGKNTQYEMADFGLAAFAAFFMQSPSFLAHQRHPAAGRGGSNCRTLFGRNRIPGDGQVR